MKKIILLAVTVLGVLTVKAQENVVKVNPLGLAFGSAELSYERAISEKGAVELSLAYSKPKITFSSGTDKATLLGVEGKYKFYVSQSKSAPRGFYIAPIATYVSTNAKSGNQKGKFSYLAGGVLGGYQWVFGKGNSGFSLDLNLGAQYASISTSGDIVSVDVDGFLPRLGIGFGYAW